MIRPRSQPDPKWTPTEVAIFADALADGDSINVASRRAGRTLSQGNRQFERMCAKLGAQAS